MWRPLLCAILVKIGLLDKMSLNGMHDMKNKQKSKAEGVVLLLVLVVCIATSSISCGSRSSLSGVYVGALEANHPWIIFDPTYEQGCVIPYADKQNCDIVYLVFGLGPKFGDAVKIDLRTKKISPYHFDVAEFADVKKFAIKYEHGFSYNDLSAPLWIEFRGKKEERVVKHLFGDPIPTRSSNRKATLRSGYYYIMDKRGNLTIELLRVKIVNSELSWAGLGMAYISPNGKWAVFTLENNPGRTFIFNRDVKDLAIFPSDHEDKALEFWKD